MKRILIFSLLVTLILQTVTVVYAESLRSRIERLKKLPQYEELTEEEIAVIEAVNQVSPAVVAIKVTDSTGRQVSSGTGFVIQEDGLVVTNKHVIGSLPSSKVLVSIDGVEYVAQVEAIDSFNDIALVRVKQDRLNIAELSSKDDILIGQTVIAIGNPFGLPKTVTRGVVSAIDRSVVARNGTRTENLVGVIQTDAAINPGNSGGPLISTNGKVVGINVATSQGGENIAFSIPVNEIRRALGSFNKTGKITKKFLGVRYTEITSEIRRTERLNLSRGVFVLEVVPGSAAERAGIEQGDVILRLGNKAVSSTNTLEKLVKTAKVREEVSVYKKKSRKIVSLTVQFEEISE